MESIVIYICSGPDQSKLVTRLLQITMVSSIYPIKLNQKFLNNYYDVFNIKLR